MQNNTIAVLTADIVHSTQMGSKIYSDAVANLQTLISQAEHRYQGAGDIFRGDEFQIQYTSPELALKSALLIKLALMFSSPTIQCTMSLAYGNYDRLDNKPNTSSGPAFIASGRGLSNTRRGELSVHLLNLAESQDIPLLTGFASYQINKLTRGQAQLLHLYIENDFAEHSSLAVLTKTSRQNISNRLKNIGADLIRDYIKAINSKIE